MKKILSLMVATGLLSTLLNAETVNSGDRRGVVAEIGKQSVASLSIALGSKLRENIEKNGLAKTVKFCSDNALLLTESVNRKLPKGVKIKRISKKNRNSFNEPDKIDMIAYKYFEELKEKNGVYPSNFITKLRHKKNKDIEIFRYYNPVLINKPCLACHGTNIKVDVKNAIASLYPDDRATGFKVGDLRGIIKVEINPDALQIN